MHRLLSRVGHVVTALALVISGTATLTGADAGAPIIRNSRVTVWESAWTPGVPTPMHFHDELK